VHDQIRVANSKPALLIASAIGAGPALTGAAAFSQSNNFTYELRLISDQATSGQICAFGESVTISFWLEARARANSLAPGNANFGVVRAATGPSGLQPSAIQLTDSVAGSRLLRGVVNPSGPGGFALTGRMPGFRSGGPVTDTTVSPWHSTADNGPNPTPFPSGSNNAFGTFDANGDRLYGFDAYVGPFRTGAINPWIADFPSVPVGQFSAWSRVYKVDLLLVNPSVERFVELNFSAYLSAGVQTQNIGGDTWLMNVSASSPASGSVTGRTSVLICPSPSAATMMALGLCVAGRRRR
jgi:hypothetical protein